VGVLGYELYWWIVAEACAMNHDEGDSCAINDKEEQVLTVLNQ
jgi:hypothetical protein